MSINMGKFELADKKFHDYNNGEIRSDIKSREDMLQDNPYINYDTRSDYELLGYLSNFLVQKDSSQKPELSFLFKLWRFLRYFRWSNKYYKSGGGKIVDYRFYAREIHYHLNKLTKISYLSSHEIRQLISASLRIYFRDGWDENTPLKLEDLYRCKNLQEFYTSEFEVDFKFADKLQNLRIVDLYSNSADNKRGIEKFKYFEKRNIKNLNFLKSCLVLNLEDSFVDDFTNIQDNVLTLSVKNSNFEDLDTISHLNKLQYLDFSENQITSLNGIENFKDLKVLNCCKIEFKGDWKSKIMFFSLLNELKNLELLVMDSNLYDDYKVCLNILPPEKLVIVSKSYTTNVNLKTFEILNHFKIAEQLNKKVTLSEIDIEPVKEIFLKKSK